MFRGERFTPGKAGSGDGTSRRSAPSRAPRVAGVYRNYMHTRNEMSRLRALMPMIQSRVSVEADGAITLLGAITPFTLLAFTFLIGACFTFYLPAQSASINDLVARIDIPRAVALGAVAFNVARAVGPALAGAAVAGTGEPGRAGA